MSQYVTKPLSGIERVYHQSGRLYAGGGKVSAVIQVKETTSNNQSSLFQRENLSHALMELAKRHPFMRSVIKEVEGVWSYVLDNTLTVPFYLREYEREDSWEQLIQHEMNSDYPMITEYEHALFYVHFVVVKLSQHVNQVTILPCCNHAVADGVSLTHIVHELLECIVGTNPSVERVDHFNSNLVEHLKGSYPVLPKSATGYNKPAKIDMMYRSEPEIHCPADTDQLPMADDQTNYYFREFDVASFQAKCRKEGVTLGSAFLSVLAFSAAQVSFTIHQQDRESLAIKSGLTLNARGHLLSGEVPDNQMGYFVGGCDVVNSIPTSITKGSPEEKTSFMLEQAKQMGEEVKRKLSDKEAIVNALLGRESFSDMIIQAMNAGVLSLKDTTLCCSNIGDVSKTISTTYRSDSSSLSVESIRVMSGISMWKTNAVYLSSIAGKLFAVFAFVNPPYTSVSDCEMFMDKVTENYNILIQE